MPQVRLHFNRVRFSGRKEDIIICSESVSYGRISSTVFVTMERTSRKLGIDRIRRAFSCNCM